MLHHHMYPSLVSLLIDSNCFKVLNQITLSTSNQVGVSFEDDRQTLIHFKIQALHSDAALEIWTWCHQFCDAIVPV